MEVEEGQDREKAVILLLGDLLSYLPKPRSTSDTLAAASGFAPGRSVPCPACGARGRILQPGKPCISCLPRLDPKRKPLGSTPDGYVPIKHGCRPCLNCKGTGWKRIHTPKGQIGTDWDEYGGVRIGAREPARDTKQWERERETARHLRRVDHLLALWEAPETVEESWERRKQAQWRSGDFGPLSRALMSLQQVAPRRFSLTWRVYVLEEPLVLSSALQERLRETVGLIAVVMPTPILMPAHLSVDNPVTKNSLMRGRSAGHTKQRGERDDEICRLRFEEHWKIARIAREFGLSEWTIKMITKQPIATVAA